MSEVVTILDEFGNDMKFGVVHSSGRNADYVSIDNNTLLSPDAARKAADALYAKASAIDGQQSQGERALELLRESIDALGEVEGTMRNVNTDGYTMRADELRDEIEALEHFITRAKAVLQEVGEL
jgi:hypothetical protein